MALIKSAKSGRLLKDAVVLDMGDLARQADRIRQSALVEAQRILAEAHAEAQRLIDGAAEQGRAEGFELGHSEGFAKGEQEGRDQALLQHSSQIQQLLTNWAAAL